MLQAFPSAVQFAEASGKVLDKIRNVGQVSNYDLGLAVWNVLGFGESLLLGSPPAPVVVGSTPECKTPEQAAELLECAKKCAESGQSVVMAGPLGGITIAAILRLLKPFLLDWLNNL